MKITTYITEITTQKYERIGMVTVKDGGRLDSEKIKIPTIHLTSIHKVATTSNPSLEKLLKRIKSLEDNVAELESELIVFKNVT